MTDEHSHGSAASAGEDEAPPLRPRITLYEALLIYALGAVAMIPLGFLNAADDGMADSFTRAALYALTGSLIPAAICIGLAAWRRSFTLGAIAVVIIALLTWRGH